MIGPAFLGASVASKSEFELVWIQDSAAASTGDWYIDLNSELRLDEFELNSDYIEFDLFIPSGAGRNIYLNLIGRNDPASNTTSRSSLSLLNNGNSDSRLRAGDDSAAGSFTFPYFHDGDTHKIRISKGSATSYAISVDGSTENSGGFSSTYFIGAIGIRRGSSARAIAENLIIKNFKVFQGGEFTYDMPINDGGTTIKNNGTGPDGTLIGVDNTDYQWVEII